MATSHEPFGVIKRLGILLCLLAAMAIFPMAALAQGAPSPANSAGGQPVAPASPGQPAGASPNVPAQAPGAAQPATGASASAAAAGSAAANPQAASAQAVASQAATAASAPAVRGLPTPVGGNAPQAAQEPLPLFAYLLIVLGVIWFFAAIAGIVRLMARPRGVAYTAAVPPAEQDRPYLSFIMPFGALLTVAVIVTIWGMIFLQTSHISENYPLAIDLFVVCLVMFIATMAALRSSGPANTEVH